MKKKDLTLVRHILSKELQEKQKKFNQYMFVTSWQFAPIEVYMFWEKTILSFFRRRSPFLVKEFPNFLSEHRHRKRGFWSYFKTQGFDERYLDPVNEFFQIYTSKILRGEYDHNISGDLVDEPADSENQQKTEVARIKEEKDELTKEVENYGIIFLDRVYIHFQRSEVDLGKIALKNWESDFGNFLKEISSLQEDYEVFTHWFPQSFSKKTDNTRLDIFSRFMEKKGNNVFIFLNKLIDDIQYGLYDGYLPVNKPTEAVMTNPKPKKIVTPKTIRKITCFLSYRFSDLGKSYASQIRRFLELLDIDVLSGEKYEPRSISEKVKNILSQNPDFVVLIIAQDGESLWTRDEIAELRVKGKPIIPLVVYGSEFAQGLFGDLEWIPFPKEHISDSFIRLLEGIRFIQSQLDHA